uniref:Uncharacterized protein n=1 Tax=Anopheles merus TaxID=30066 RepID=A0A182V5U9_ANOME
MEKVTLDVLRNKLSAGTEDEFLAAYEKYCQQNNGHVPPEEERAELLSVAVYQAKLTAAQKLVDGQMVDGKFTGNPKLLSGLLSKCCNRGNVQMLEWLLRIIPDEEVALVNKDPLLSLLVKQIDVYTDNKESSYIRSMRILLNDPRLDIDKSDVKKCTAMHYAVKYKNDHAQELLLDEGAYIWGENIFGDLPNSEMDSSLLEKHLDSCVTNNDRKPGDEDYEVRISFANFIPPAHNPNSEDEMRPITIRAESELVGIMEMVSIICRYEKAQEGFEFIHSTLGKIKFLKLGWLFPNLKLFCNENPLHQIVLKPSDQSLSTIRLEQQIINTIENGGMRKKRTSSTNNTAANSSEMRNGQEEIQLITTNETISNMENGQERTRPTNKNCQLPTHKTYQAKSLLYKPFKEMLSKIVTKSIEILNSRQMHGGSQAQRLSRMEQNMTKIMQELKELNELVRGIGKGRRGDGKKS